MKIQKKLYIRSVTSRNKFINTCLSILNGLSAEHIKPKRSRRHYIRRLMKPIYNEKQHATN